MKILIGDSDRRGSPDHLHVVVYPANTECDMPDELGAIFVREGWGAEVKPPEPKAEVQPDAEVKQPEPKDEAKSEVLQEGKSRRKRGR